MGWSCRIEASHVMERWTVACLAQTDSQNTFTEDGQTYFWEYDAVEHDDGAITGEVFRIVGARYSMPAGSFRIEGDGTVSRAPKFLRDATPSGRAAGSHGVSL